MDRELIIEEKPLKGDDGYKIFSLRIKKENLKRLEELSKITNQSRNALINKFIEYGLDNYKIKKNDHSLNDE